MGVDEYEYMDGLITPNIIYIYIIMDKVANVTNCYCIWESVKNAENIDEMV